MRVILASKSPRRCEILTTLGVSFEIVVSQADETCFETDPAKLVEILSRRKAEAVLAGGDFGDDTLIIGCDTVVAIDGKILGKPKDGADAERMLHLLSGRTHEVFSGLTMLYNGKVITSHDRTEVRFVSMTDCEIRDYIASGEPNDKAGAYAIQGAGARFIAGINGCYYNVVGLPVALLTRLIRENNLSGFFE